MMGDTGSMFLGGLVVAASYALECPIILLPVGIVYVIEALYDVIQIRFNQNTKRKRCSKWHLSTITLKCVAGMRTKSLQCLVL